MPGHVPANPVSAAPDHRPANQQFQLHGHNRYQYVRPLNSGAYGSVHMFTDVRTGESVAIKFLARSEGADPNLERELRNSRRLNHPHIIQFREVFLTEQHVCIVMEYASGGCLFDFVMSTREKRLKETEARWFFQQLVVALDYCHRTGVVNRDVKLENTLLQPVKGLALPLAKVCDFGLSKSSLESAPHTCVGTVPYMAPEVLSAGHGAPYDGQAADAWSCGVMLYAMLFGRYPFEDPRSGAQAEAVRAAAMMDRIRRCEWAVPADVPVSAGCRNLLNRLLDRDPASRIRMEQILQHPWYLANLPPGVMEMNERCLAHPEPAGSQSEEQLLEVLAAAPLPPLA